MYTYLHPLSLHDALPISVEAHDWMHGTLARSQGHINSKLNGGLSFLATVGSTAPFVGLFGTVIGILRALVKIGASGQARSEEHTSELQSLMRISYAVFCLKTKTI